MGTHLVGKTEQFSDDGVAPVLVTVEGIKIGVYKFKGKYYAYENECAHEGGPVLEGLTVGDVVCSISPNGRRIGEHFSETKRDIVCPWHGVAYDIETGVCKANRRLALTAYEVIIEDGDVKVKI
ncbi:MAG: Rieske (2Fe-2S) protein [Nitrososphaerales archaeon]